MKAMILRQTDSLEETDNPLELTEVPTPKPGHGEVLLQVLTCGVCHTELDEIEGRISPSKWPIIPGHEVVGRVAEIGSGVTQYKEGDRLGVGWVHCSSGGVDENLSSSSLTSSTASGWGLLALAARPIW